jgi:hypothetical protein
LPRFAATSLADFAIAEPSGFDSDLNTLPASSNQNEAAHLTAPNATYDRPDNTAARHASLSV